MVTVTIKNIPEAVYDMIRNQAKTNHRSINGEILSIFEQAISIPPFDIQETLKRARKVRELTAQYKITADEIEKLINEGRE